MGTKEHPGPLYQRGIGVRWEGISLGGANYSTFTVPELVTLAVIDGKMDKKDVKGKKKAEVCTIMQPYFLLKQADLPAVHRTNAGVAAARLDDP